MFKPTSFGSVYFDYGTSFNPSIQGISDVLRRHGSLEGALADGRFPTIADDLRLYRRVAAMDPSAPLPELALRVGGYVISAAHHCTKYAPLKSAE